MWFFNFDFQEIFIVLCSWIVIKFYCTYKIDICEKSAGHVHRQEQILTLFLLLAVTIKVA